MSKPEISLAMMLCVYNIIWEIAIHASHVHVLNSETYGLEHLPH